MRDAIRTSILFPGGGYFYTGHPVLGIMDAITEGFLILLLVSNVIVALEEVELWGSVLIVAVFLFLEKLISIYHAKHYINEYIPTDKNISMISFSPAPAPSSPYQQPQKQGQRRWVGVNGVRA